MKTLVITIAQICKGCDPFQFRPEHHTVIRMVFPVLAMIVTVGCSATRIPNLTQEEVIGISNRVVEDHNYDLDKYEAPDANYEYAKNDNQWWVYYQMKPKEPLHHMSVFVHDKTKKIKFYAPE